MKNHEQQHGEERGYTCDHCGKSFARDAYLRIHMKVHAKRGEVPPKPARRYHQINKQPIIIIAWQVDTSKYSEIFI